MTCGDFFRKIISCFLTNPVQEQEDFLLDSELSYLFLINGCLVSLQSIEDLLKAGNVKEAKEKAPISVLYTLWYVTQVVEKFEENRLESLGRSEDLNKGTQLFNLIHIYLASAERFGIQGNNVLHNYIVHALQVTDELIKEVRKQRHSSL